MSDLIYKLLCVVVFGCGFMVVCGVLGLSFEFLCKHISPLNTWVNELIGKDEDCESEA